MPTDTDRRVKWPYFVKKNKRFHYWNGNDSSLSTLEHYNGNGNSASSVIFLLSMF
jgi:hypothetical protein